MRSLTNWNLLRNASSKGFSLVGALILVAIISLTMAVIGTIFLKTLRVQHGIKIYKTTKEAAESAAYALVDYMESNLGQPPIGSCTDANGNSCTLDCSNSTCRCTIDWNKSTELKNIADAIKNSPAIGEYPVGYILKNCTDGTTQIYTILISVNSTQGAGGTRIMFIYAY